MMAAHAPWWVRLLSQPSAKRRREIDALVTPAEEREARDRTRAELRDVVRTLVDIEIGLAREEASRDHA